MKKLLLVLLAWLAMLGSAFGAVNINTATKEQLDTLKGIGPAKAQAIIDYRTKNGPFKTIDDLEKVPGIGPATMKEIRGEIAVSGTTTTPAADKGKKDAVDPKKAVKKGDDKSAPKSGVKAAKKDESKAADAKAEKK